jgi:hypothetical protein
VAHPSAFGLANVTQSAAPGLEAGDSSYNTGLIVPQPNTYLFWDNLHPTATVHSMLGRQAADLLLRLAGDYNDDGVVNAADYTVWRNSRDAFGSGLVADGNRDGGVDVADFVLWKSRYGNTRATGALAGMGQQVPEPNSLIGALVFAALGLTLARNRETHGPRSRIARRCDR